MHARSAVVDLYGDHLPAHGWWAPVASIVRLTGTVGVQAPATRTAISRLVAQGWLAPAQRGGVRGYAATPDARERWRHAHTRIYSPGPAPWDGSWHVVHVDSGGERRRRDQVATTLSYLGYGRLGGGTWVSPRPSPELAGSLGRLQVRWVAVHGPLDLADPGAGATWTDPDAGASGADPGAGASGADPGAGAPGAEVRALAASVWDLQSLGSAYTTFTDLALHSARTDAGDPRSAYVARTTLVHEWRRFLFRDPDLPAAVLPQGWPGHRAREVFLQTAELLAPAAAELVAAVLGGDAGSARHPRPGGPARAIG